MRILILAANFMTMPYPVYPLGAAVIAESARRTGHEVKLLDLLADSEFKGYDFRSLEKTVADFQPDCLGLSLRNLESADSSNADEHWSLDLIKRIVDDLRSMTSAPIALGGAGFSLMPETVLKCTGADYGLAGEGEEIWPAFLAALENGRAAKGLWAKAKPGARQLSAYEPDLVRRYAERGGLIGLETKRGRPLNCLYCSYPLLEGRRIRPRPVGEVLEDIARLAAIIREPHLAFADAVFNDPAGDWRKLLRAMVDSKIKIHWTAFFQPAEFEPGDLDLIKASGVSGLEFGTDGSNDSALRGLNKSFDLGLVKHIQNQCAAAGIPAAHYVIFGGPGENESTVEEGLANLEALPGCVVFASAGLSVYPGTPLFDLARKENLLAQEELQRPMFYYSPDIDPCQLDLRLRQAFDGRRDRLYPFSRSIERTEALRRMGFKGILWDTLIGSGRRERKAAVNG